MTIPDREAVRKMEEGQSKLKPTDDLWFEYHLQRVDDVGVWHPSIKEAAELVAVDMWYEGLIEGVNEPAEFTDQVQHLS